MWKIEKSPDNRKKCNRCEQTCYKGSLRISLPFSHIWRGRVEERTNVFHLFCFTRTGTFRNSCTLEEFQTSVKTFQESLGAEGRVYEEKINRLREKFGFTRTDE